MRECGICSAKVPDDQDRCPACGFTLPKSAAAPAPRAERHPTVNRPPPVVPDSEERTSTSLQRDPGDFGVGSTVSGKYLVLEPIGAGGMGHVWKARHVGLDSLVAIKVLRSEYAKNTDMLQRFEREARNASKLKHPNSIEMKDFGRLEDGGLFIAMEYVGGRDLASVLLSEWPLGEARVCHIGAQVLSALSAAHEAGVIHRDLKPENVMLERIGDDPDFVKVLDFGIATLASTSGDRPGEVSGTPQYMSPELIGGLPVDHRSDLYAMGVMLYRMVTGVLPFEGKGSQEVMRKHASEAPVPPRQRKPDAACSLELEALILRALSKDPAKRPKNADQFRRELLLIGERAAAKPALELRSIPVVPAAGAAATSAVKSAMPAAAHPIADANLQRAIARARFWRKNRRAFVMLALLALLAGGFYVANRQTNGEVGRHAIAARNDAAAWIYAYAMEQKARWDELQRKGPLDGVKPANIGIRPAAAPTPPPEPATAPAPAPPPAPTPAPEPVKPKPVAAPAAKAPEKAGASADPRCPAGMVFVEGATFPFGEKGGARSVMLVGVKSSCIDRYEFPNKAGEPPRRVGGVGEAVSLCASRGRRLCRDEEWEHACKGPDDLAYPYAATPDPAACNTGGAVGKAGAFERCVSGYGAFDMVGNVAEWVAAAREPGSVARRKGGGSSEPGNCAREAREAPDVPAGFRCCADPKSR